MAETSFIEIAETTWTDISGTTSVGFITNHSDNTVLYLTSDTQPLDTITMGHRLRPGSAQSFNITGTEKVWARSIHAPAKIIMTPDVFRPGGGPNSTDYFYDVSAGRVPGVEAGFIISGNPNIGNLNSETIWDYGGNLVYLTADTTLFVSSDNAADVGVTVLVQGLNDQYERITATAVLNGQTQVALNIPMFRVFTIFVIGTQSPLGIVYLAEADTLTGGEPDTPAKVKGTIPLATNSVGTVIDSGTEFASDNFSHLGLYTVPAGMVLRTNDIFVGCAKNDNVKIGGRIRVGPTSVWLNRNPTLVYQGNARVQFILPLNLPEQTDLEFRAVSGNDGGSAHIELKFTLEEVS